jgi:acetyl esterase/lipase
VIHPDVAARFPMLDGIVSMREAYGTPKGLERIRAYESWEPEEAPPVVEVRDDVAPGPHGPVPVRVYEPPAGGRTARPCLIWAHGGGFLGGDLDMREADWTAREVCVRAGAVVVSVDYRLAVDGVSYPVPHDDTVAAVCWVRDNVDVLGVDAGRISIGGASAGANLTAGAVLKLRDRDGWLPRTLLFVYGVAHPVVPPPSPAVSAALEELPGILAPKVGRRDDFLTVNYLGGPVSSADGYAMPALAVLEGLCPVLVLNAEYDDLRPSGEAFTAALAVAGVDVHQVTVRGLLHGFLNQPAELEPVGECLGLIAATVKGLS